MITGDFFLTVPQVWEEVMKPKGSLGSAWTEMPREVWGELGPRSSVLVASGIFLMVLSV